jgi:acyl-coenzyme A thioesterase PaaI-like protein
MPVRAVDIMTALRIGDTLAYQQRGFRGMDESDQSMISAPSSENWRPMSETNPYNDHIGPFFVREEGLEPGEPVRFGFRVQRHHCNQRLTCHGGMLASFLDLSLARGLAAAEGFFGPTPTISITADFLAGAQIGAWVESRVNLLHRTKQIGFLHALIVSEGKTLVRGSGTYKRPRPIPAD